MLLRNKDQQKKTADNKGQQAIVIVGKDEVPGSNPGNSSNKNLGISTVPGFFVFSVPLSDGEKPTPKPTRGLFMGLKIPGKG